MTNYARFLICVFFGLCTTFSTTDVCATDVTQTTSLDISKPQNQPIGNHLVYLQTKDKLSPLNAYEKLDKEGIHSTTSVPNFGITSDIVWLQLTVQNPTAKTLLRTLWTESIWLDKIAIYKINKGQRITTLVTTIGDIFPFSARRTDHRQLSFNYSFPPGETTFLIEVTNNDPTSLNLWVSSEQEFHLQNNHATFSYGILYGAILSLLIYNLLMFLSIKETYHLYFSLYLFSFLIANLGYSGHAFMWFWPNSPLFEQYVVLFLMVLYGIAGIIFALNFLKLNTSMPKLSTMLHWANGLILLILSIFAAFDYHLGCAVIAFYYIPLFSFTMLVLGFIALRQNNPSAKYFILATMTGAIGASITALTVAGALPFTYLGFRAVDIGVSLDVVLLAFAVAYKFRRSEEARETAEFTANTDSLTLLDNRRAFNAKVSKLWLLGKREQSPAAVIIIDIDHFKDINDKYSHDAGDNVLIKIAKILKESVRDSDVLCRWGGEEFLIYLPETNEIGACSLADKIKINMNAASFSIDNTEIKVSASFGVSERTKTDKQVGEVIKRSDKALYIAKGCGRNRFQAWSELRTSL
tara:strand:- start:665 stop:2407 length:1743 start_codon:yes stop_codon:yes gene_type:complete